MKIFPTYEKSFKLIGSQSESLDRLKRRTEKSEYLTSQYTDKSFRGELNNNKFKLISSAIGKGVFCVLKGEINSGNGFVKVEIHKVFRGFLIAFFCFPIIGFFVLFFSQEDFSPLMILVAIAQVFFIRFVFIGLAFKFLSRGSLNRLRDVIDFEWIN